MQNFRESVWDSLIYSNACTTIFFMDIFILHAFSTELYTHPNRKLNKNITFFFDTTETHIFAKQQFFKLIHNIRNKF